MQSLTKICPDCKEIKPVSAYTRNRRNKDGLCTYCRACQALRLKGIRPDRPYRSQEAALARVKAGEKVCPTCGVMKPLTTEFFYASPDRADKHCYYCKICQSALQQRSADPERLRCNRRAYYLRRHGESC